MSIKLTSPQVSNLLNELCVELGFCLSPSECARLENEPPNDIDLFTDEVFRSEGLDPHSDLNLRRQVYSRISTHFKAAEDAAIVKQMLDG